MSEPPALHRRDHLDRRRTRSGPSSEAAGPSRYSGVVANITGNPAMSVPLSWNDDGLPIGVHFLGRFGDEATLFRLAAQLEVARPWSTAVDRWPRRPVPTAPR